MSIEKYIFFMLINNFTKISGQKYAKKKQSTDYSVLCFNLAF